jgi:hypothetical protein
VFTKNTPHTGNGTQRATGKSFIVKVCAISTTTALGAVFALAVPTTASAATRPTSFAAGQFLSGSILGTNLANVASLGGATASNNGAQSMQVDRDPLTVGALGSTVINQPGGVQLNLGQIVDAGALNEYARASADGTSMGASGAINNDGGIGVGKVGTAVGGDATVDLDSLLGARYASVLSDLKLQATAVAAQASGKLKSASGSYSLAGLKLNFTSPVIANLGGRLSSALDPVTAQLSSLNGANGALAKSVNGVTTRLNPLLNVLGTHATVNASVNANLNASLAPLLQGNYTTDGVSFNLKTGAVAVDLAKLLGGRINSEPVGTQVLSDAVVEQILHGITSQVASLGDQVDAKVKTALGNAAVNVDVVVATQTAQAPLLSKTCTQQPSTSTGGSSSGGLLGGLGGLGGLLGGSGGTGSITTPVTTIVGGLLCTTTKRLLPNLATGAAVHIHGTVDQIVAGHAPVATATATVLSVPVALSVNAIVGGLGSTLASHLLGSDGALGKVNSSVESKLVDPVVTGLLGNASSGAPSVAGALTKALSITLNNQDVSKSGVFTETALKVAALPTTTGSVATVNLASAAVGPNVTKVVPTAPGDPSNPGDPGTPTSPGTPSNPGTPGTSGNPGTSGGLLSSPVSPAAFSRLAFTGIGIGTLVAVILALLAAGAYLVREGYRRNGRRQVL